jgi:glycerol-3-phosphate dehydrogenase
MGPAWTHDAMLPDDAARLGDATEFAPGLGPAQVDFLMREEWALTAEDILWRRTKLGLVATPAQAAALSEYLMSARQLAKRRTAVERQGL